MATNKQINKQLDILWGVRDKFDAYIEELQEKFDNKSEAWQEGEKGSALSDIIYKLEELRDGLKYAEDLRELVEVGK